jgi:hypothetical protein
MGCCPGERNGILSRKRLHPVNGPEQMEAMRKQAAARAAAQHEPAIRRSVQESSQLSSDLWNDTRCQVEMEQLVGELLQSGIMELLLRALNK